MKTVFAFTTALLIGLSSYAGKVAVQWDYNTNDVRPDLGWYILSTNNIAADSWPILATVYARDFGSFNVVTNTPDPSNPSNTVVTTNFVGPSTFTITNDVPDGRVFFTAITFTGTNGTSNMSNFIETNRPVRVRLVPK